MAVLGALSSGAAIVDSLGYVRATNLELQRLLGAQPGQVILAQGERFVRVGPLLALSEEATIEIEEALTAMLAGEREHLHLELEVTSLEPVRAYTLDGARIPSAGEPAAVLELRDVSQAWAQRRSLEHELRLLQTLFDAIPSPLFYKDTEGIFLGCNRAFEVLSGQGRERMVGGTVFEFAPRPFASEQHGVDMALMREGSSRVDELRLQYPDGSERDVLCTRVAVKAESGEVVGMGAVMFDITERKAMEDALRAREEELRRQNLSLSTPILELADKIVALPIIGAVDAARAELIMERLLAKVAAGCYRVVIIDVTGMEEVDAETAAHFTRLVRAVELLGAVCLLCGLSPGVAQALVGLDVDLSAVRTLRNLKQALRAGVEILQRDA